jgi:hypothetical protein
MRRAPSVALVAAALAFAAVARAEPPTTAPTTPGGTTAPPTTTRGGVTTAPPVATAPAPTAPTVPAAPAAGPPKLSSLRLARVTTSQQGHAQFLVGARTSTAAKLTVRLSSLKTKALIRTVTSQTTHAAGRVYFLIEATTEQRFQIPAGVYHVEVRATDDQDRTSNTLKGNFRLVLTPPRGRLDVFTVPLWPSLARLLGVPPLGQLVAAVGPGGIAAKAGIRRGDVITSIGGRPVERPGQLTTALRTLKANAPVAVGITRDGKPRTLQVTPQPDWTKQPDYARALRVALSREPNSLPYAYAAVRQLIEANEDADAKAMLDDWRPGWKTTGVGQALQGDLLAADGQQKRALGAYNRALAKDPGIIAAQFGRGLALSSLNRFPESADAFSAALTADPADAGAASFRAYVLLKENLSQDALTSAESSIKMDPSYEDGYLARGLALLAQGQKAAGLRALKRGLLLLPDPNRAAELISSDLEPNDP